MITKYFPSVIALIFIFSIKTTAQNDPTFDEFIGTVYKIPAKQVGKKYGEHVKNFEVVGDIRLLELNIPE